MSRDELLAYLTRAVADGLMSEEEAAGVLRRFDEGQDLGGLSLPPQTPGVDGAAVGAAMATLAGLVALSPSGARDALQARYEQAVETLAERLASGALSVAGWQGAMLETLRLHLLAQAGAGNGGVVPREMTGEIEAALTREAAYLSRWADQIVAGLLVTPPGGATGAALSLAALTSRAGLYGGSGWALWYRANELDYTRRGYVVDYIARDDERTCDACLSAEANGPYLPGAGPYPGTICRGGGRCRCERRERYDLAAWQRLTGQR